MVLLIDKKSVSEALIEDINKRIISLQWKAIELNIIFTSKDAKYAISQYQKSLDDLRKAVDNSNTQEILSASRDFANSTKRVIELLALQADLAISITE